MSPQSLDSCYAYTEGGAVYATRYIDDNLRDQHIIEYWNPFYRFMISGGNTYSSLACQGESQQIAACLKEGSVRYYLDDTLSRSGLSSSDGTGRQKTIDFFLANGKKIFEYFDQRRNTYIRLYELPR
jgi:hypothetical protein